MARPGPERPVLVFQATVPGTLSRFFRGLLGWLRRQGMEVHAVASPGPAMEEMAGREGISCHELPMSRRISPLADLLSLLRAVRLYARLRPSIVHGFTPKAGLTAMLAAWITRRPVRLYTIFGFPHLTKKGALRWLLVSCDRISCALAHRVYFQCESIRQVAIAERICRAEKSRVMPAWNFNTIGDSFARTEGLLESGRELRRDLGIPACAPVIGYIGRLTRDKGLPELIDAFELLAPRFPELRLVLVGRRDGTDRVPERTLSRIEAHDRILEVGHQRDVPRYLAAFDLLVLPSLREGIGTVSYEAAAMELPVVSTRIPGNIDTVADGLTGTLVPPCDAEALAGAIRRYIEDPGLRASHGREGRQRLMRNFPLERLWEGLLDEYTRLLRPGA